MNLELEKWYKFGVLVFREVDKRIMSLRFKKGGDSI